MLLIRMLLMLLIKSHTYSCATYDPLLLGYATLAVLLKKVIQALAQQRPVAPM